MPYRDLGVVKNATKEAMLNLEDNDGKFILKAYTTSTYKNATVTLQFEGEIIIEETVDFSPEMSFEKAISEKINTNKLYIKLENESGVILVDWHSESHEQKPIPEAAKPAKDPKDISSVEQLYLRGLHLEQYRHATYSPTDYYLEALKREPTDVRNNNAMGLWYMKHGQLTKAEPYFRKVIDTLTERNPNPYDGEPLFNLGLCLQFQHKTKEAYDFFFKSTWNGAWQDSGFFHCAQLDALHKNYHRALEIIDRSLYRNWHNQKGRHLKVVLLRKTDAIEAAKKLAEDSLQLDRFNFGILFEQYLLTKDIEVLQQLKALMRSYEHNFIEFSLDYAAAGFYQEALDFINIYTDAAQKVYPMAQYFKAYYTLQLGDKCTATSLFKTAAQLDPDYCFPHRIEELIVLKKATIINSEDAKAWYYLGNFWYGARQHEDAIACWEKSRDIDDTFPTVHRNLALGYYNKQNNAKKAQKSLETAYALNPSDARVLMELDQLYKKLNINISTRLSILEKAPEQVNFRDDLYLEYITLLNLSGEEEKALYLINTRQFHPWEGGEGKVPAQYLYSHVALAKKAIFKGDYEIAIIHLNETFHYPHHLGEGKIYGAQENDFNYWLGCAYEALGDHGKATLYWEKASQGLSTPAAAMYYNDQQPDKIFYQGLALKKIGQIIEAVERFKKLINFGEAQLKVPFKMDYFAVSLPDLLIFEDDLQIRHEYYCYYLIGLGHLGLDNIEVAQKAFKRILQQNRYHIGARIHLEHCKKYHSI
jgi:tetratricopeptide (TPR) repeat protein